MKANPERINDHENGRTALSHACKKNQLETVDLLQGLNQMHDHNNWVAELLIALLDQNELPDSIRNRVAANRRLEIKHQVYFRHSLMKHLLWFMD